MRDIKFRAWNKNTSKMVDLYKITPLALSMEQDGLFLPFSDDYVLMQYIGYKDLEGTEVYEGDIIKFPADNQPYVVKWIEHEGGWGVMYQSIQMGKPGIVEFMHVIGNIYENKELLNAK